VYAVFINSIYLLGIVKAVDPASAIVHAVQLPEPVPVDNSTLTVLVPYYFCGFFFSNFPVPILIDVCSALTVLGPEVYGKTLTYLHKDSNLSHTGNILTQPLQSFSH
jgi:hypothetical protein